MRLMTKLLLLASLLLPSGSWAAGQAAPFVSQSFCGLDDADSAAAIPDCAAQTSNNFEADLSGTSLLKRKGFERIASLTYSTAVVTGAGRFISATGDDIVVNCHDVICQRSVNRGTFTNFLTTATLGVRFWSMAETDNVIYMLNDQRDKPAVYDGTTLTYSNTIPRGKLIAVLPTRMVVANTAADPNSVNYSASDDFTNHTVGPETEDPWTDSLGAPGDQITCLENWLGDLLICKNRSLTLCEVNDQYTTTCSSLVDHIGVSDPDAIVVVGDRIYLKSPDNAIWRISRREGIAPVSSRIRGTLQDLAAGQLLSNVQSSQTDWNNGIQSPTGTYSTSIEFGSIVNASVTFVNTSSSDFAAGTLQGVSITDVVGSIVLSSTTLQDAWGNNLVAGRLAWVTESGTLSASAGELRSAADGQNNLVYSSSMTISSGSWSWTYRYDTSGNDGVPARNCCTGAGITGSGAEYCSQIRFMRNAGNDYYDVKVQEVSNCNSASATKTVKFSKTVSGSETVLSQFTHNFVDKGTEHTFKVDRATSGVTNVFINDVFVASTTDTSISSSTRMDIVLNGYEHSPVTVRNVIDDFYAYRYNSPSVFTSAAFNTNFSTSIGGPFSSTFTASGLSSGYGVFFDVRASSNGAQWSDWRATSDTLHTGTTQQYVQWQGRFHTDYSTRTPQIDSVEMPNTSTGTYRTQCIEPGTGITAWGALTCAESNTGSGSIVYYATSAFSCAALPATAPTQWTSQTNNATISIATNAAVYIGWRDVLGSTTDTVKVQACTVNWEAGTIAQPTTSIYDPIKNAIYWSVQTSTATSNDKVLKQDLNRAEFEFYPFSLNVGPMLYYDNLVHFGSSNGGFWNRFGADNVNSDNGSAYTATWKTKDFSFGRPFEEKIFQKLSVLAKNEQTGSLSITWATERSGGDSFSVSLSTASQYPYIRLNHNMKLQSPANTMSLTFQNASANQPVHILGYGVWYYQNDWRPLVP